MKKTIVLFVLIVVGISSGQTYRYSAYLYQSSPEAGLFFSNPSYISPARAEGVTGMFANPAALGFSSDYGIAMVGGTPAHPKIKCNFKVLDSTDQQSELKIPFALGFKEAGGFNFLGISKKLGPVGIGFGYMQKSATGLGFDYAASSDTFSITYSFKDTVEASYAGGDTSIPVTWQLRAPLVIDSKGKADFTLAKQPLFIGIGSASGLFGYGLGFKLQKYSGNLDGSVFLAGGASMIGTGIPDAPFKGSIEAGGIVPYDTIFIIRGDGEVNSNRASLIAGGLIKTGIFKMGITLEKTFASTMNGDFNILSSVITNFSDSVVTETSFVNFILPDSVSGRKFYRLLPQARSEDTSGFSGPVSLPGYTQIDWAMSLLLFDLYLGGTVPQKGEINSFKIGSMISIPLSNLTIRTGMLANLDYLITNDEEFIPLRIPIYIGLGGSYETTLPYVQIENKTRFDFGIKTNSIPLFSKTILDFISGEDDIDVITDLESPSFLSLLSFNLGVSVNL
ncbi:MAG: hypothetical protein KGZ86_03915 [Candidatus Latescibacteria bacterium]|nr:hypothetical protein [Candidatus Latescibacterota bacterium]